MKFATSPSKDVSLRNDMISRELTGTGYEAVPEEVRKFRAWLAREPKEEFVPQPMFYLHGIPYLPSYNDKHKWVGPSHDTR